jgi:ribosome maturation factor RimP
MQPTPDELTAEIRSRVAALGFDVVDVRKGGTAQRVRLQVRVDRLDARPGHGITVDECAAVSRALEAWLDASGVAGTRYVLEVSSPGIERPVRFVEHWERLVGADVRVRLPDVGRVRATIVGVSPARDAVELRPEGETSRTVPLEEIRDATLVVDWDASGLHVRGPQAPPRDGGTAM